MSNELKRPLKELLAAPTLAPALNHPLIREKLRQVLGERAMQFAAALLQLERQTWSLQKCTADSKIGSAITVAILDLAIEPSLGEAYLVAYGNVCTFQLGYKGLLQLCLRSGAYQRLGATTVYEGELVGYNPLWGEIDYDPAKRTSDRVLGYAAAFRTVNGFSRAEYWPVERVLKHAEQYSQAYRAGLKDPRKRDNSWFTAPDKMGMKTVLKSLQGTWGPKSMQIQRALKADEAHIDIEGEVQGYPDNGGQLAGTSFVSPQFEQSGDEAAEAAMGLAPVTTPPEMAKRGRPRKEPPILTATPPETTVPNAPGEQPTPPAPESPQVALQEVLAGAGVAFEDFRGWLITTGFAPEDVAATIIDWQSVPDGLAESLLKPENAPKLARCVKLYGKN